MEPCPPFWTNGVSPYNATLALRFTLSTLRHFAATQQTVALFGGMRTCAPHPVGPLNPANRISQSPTVGVHTLDYNGPGVATRGKVRRTSGHLKEFALTCPLAWRNSPAILVISALILRVGPSPAPSSQVSSLGLPYFLI